MLGLWISRHILPVLTAGITIPLWLIVAGGVWLHFDKSSAVRKAVDRAVVDLVHSAEIEAAKAREEGLRKILVERERQAERDRAALTRFAELLSAAEHQKGALLDEIAELEAQPAPDACIVDPALADRLRVTR